MEGQKLWTLCPALWSLFLPFACSAQHTRYHTHDFQFLTVLALQAEVEPYLSAL